MANKTKAAVKTKEEKALAAQEKKEQKARAAAKKKADVAKANALAAKEPKLIDHEVTQDDLDKNPDLVTQGIKVGDTIKVPEVTGKYHVVFEFNDQEVVFDTDSIQDTIVAFDPGYIKTRFFITITSGKKTIEKVLFTAVAKRLFTNKLSALIFEKNILKVLGE